MAISLLVEIIGDASKLASELDSAEGKTKSFGDSAIGSAVKVAAIGAAAVGVAVAIGEMTMSAAEDRAEQEKLLTTYQNAGAAVGEYTASIDAAIAAGAEKAFSDSEVRAGLDSLVTATGNAEEANALLAISQDVARKAGVSLEQAADAVAKAHSGQDAALRKLFPGMEKQKNAADTLTEATKLSKGAADDYAESAEGMGKRGSDAFAEIGEQVGQVFLPILDEVLPALLPIIELLGELITAVLPLLKPAISLIVGALKIFISVLETLIGVIKQVLDWVGDMVRRVQDAANFIGSIDLNPFSAGGGTGAAPLPAGRSAGGGGGTGGATINMYVSGDPVTIERAVIQALRTYSRRTGRTIGGI